MRDASADGFWGRYHTAVFVSVGVVVHELVTCKRKRYVPPADRGVVEVGLLLHHAALYLLSTCEFLLG